MIFLHITEPKKKVSKHQKVQYKHHKLKVVFGG